MLMLMMLTFYDDADDGDVLTTLISVQCFYDDDCYAVHDYRFLRMFKDDHYDVDDEADFISFLK